jgi:hypothetical protein
MRNVTRTRRLLTHGTAVLCLTLGVASGCASHGRGERAGRAVDRGVDKVDRGADRAADKVEYGAERAADKVDRAVDELKN